MVKLELLDNLHVKINTDNWGYLKDVKERFSEYKEGYLFNAKYKANVWDGKISMFNGGNKTLPFGLLLEFVKFHKTKYPEIPLQLTDDVKALFNGIDVDYNKDLSFQPYDYQDDCISTCLRRAKCIIKSATASGKCSFDIDVEVEIDDDVYEEHFSDYEKIE